MNKFAALLALLATAATPGFAATQTVTLSVPGMTCAACPFTVKKALTKVKGVSKATASFEAKQATVTFDDTQTSVAALIKATTEAGFASAVAK